MFEHLAKFRVVIVTGPQRSGTRITAKMIAHDTGHQFIDERAINIDSLYRLVDALRLNGVVVQCPALSRWVHTFGQNEDIAIVMVRRPVEDIIASQERINWTEQFEMIELIRYGAIKGPIARVKYDYWDSHQKEHILNAFDVNYEDLSNHPLWIDKSKRADFGPHQTRVVHA